MTPFLDINVYGISEASRYEVFLEDEDGESYRILKNGVEVESTRRLYELGRMIAHCIDVNAWKYSWHIDSHAFKDQLVFDRLKEILIAIEANHKKIAEDSRAMLTIMEHERNRLIENEGEQNNSVVGANEPAQGFDPDSDLPF